LKDNIKMIKKSGHLKINKIAERQY